MIETLDAKDHQRSSDGCCLAISAYASPLAFIIVAFRQMNRQLKSISTLDGAQLRMNIGK